MFFINRNKLKVRSEEDEDGVKTSVEYYRVKQKDSFKVKVLNELIGDKLCLMILDSKLLYFEKQEKPQILFKEIIEHLDTSKVLYKKIELKKVPEVSMFGVTVKKGSKKTDKDYIVGVIVSKKSFRIVEEYANKLNAYYIIDKTGLKEEMLLQKLEENYEEVDEIGKDFYCKIFDNNFSGQLAISSEGEQAVEIKEIVEKCYSELK